MKSSGVLTKYSWRNLKEILENIPLTINEELPGENPLETIGGIPWKVCWGILDKIL